MERRVAHHASHPLRAARPVAQGERVPPLARQGGRLLLREGRGPRQDRRSAGLGKPK